MPHKEVSPRITFDASKTTFNIWFAGGKQIHEFLMIKLRSQSRNVFKKRDNLKMMTH